MSQFPTRVAILSKGCVDERMWALEEPNPHGDVVARYRRMRIGMELARGAALQAGFSVQGAQAGGRFDLWLSYAADRFMRVEGVPEAVYLQFDLCAQPALDRQFAQLIHYCAEISEILPIGIVFDGLPSRPDSIVLFSEGTIWLGVNCRIDADHLLRFLSKERFVVVYSEVEGGNDLPSWAEEFCNWYARVPIVLSESSAGLDLASVHGLISLRLFNAYLNRATASEECCNRLDYVTSDLNSCFVQIGIETMRVSDRLPGESVLFLLQRETEYGVCRNPGVVLVEIGDCSLPDDSLGRLFKCAMTNSKLYPVAFWFESIRLGAPAAVLFEEGSICVGSNNIELRLALLRIGRESLEGGSRVSVR